MATTDPVAFLRDRVAWLAAPELGVCIVGSSALRISCVEAGIAGPDPGDLDLAWALDIGTGKALLEQHGVFLATTEGNLARGTLAMSVDGTRIEVTTLRGTTDETPLADRITADLAERDMTIGSVAVELATGRIHDPNLGLEDWRRRRVVAVGDPADRVRVHPIRWLRYFRKAHQLGFDLDRAIRSLRLDPTVLADLPPEAVALELRAMLLGCSSPGRCLLELHEAGLLETLSPEIARQFDGRPAGRQRWHPEVSQALHLILALEWIVEHTREMTERDRLAVHLAVLTHDLGKGYTPDGELPAHRGHEEGGVEHVERFLGRWPGLADSRTRMLARHVCALHLVVRRFDQLRTGTLARLYEERFRAKDYPVRLFALAVGADSAGRLGLAHQGKPVCEQVAAQIEWLRSACAGVDAGALREQHPDDIDGFRRALHEARTRAIRAARPTCPSPAAPDPADPDATCPEGEDQP